MRDALHDVRARKRDLRDAIKDAKSEHTKQVERIPVTTDGAMDQQSDEWKHAQTTHGRVLNLEAQLRSTEEEESRLLARVAGVDPAFPTRRLVSDPEVMQTLHELAASTVEIPNPIRLGEIMSAEEACALTGAMLRAD